MVVHSEYMCLRFTYSLYRKNINVETPGLQHNKEEYSVLDVKIPEVWWGGDELLCVLLKVIRSIKLYKEQQPAFPVFFK